MGNFIFLKKELILRKIFSSIVQQPLVGQGLLFIEASRSHPDTPYSVGLLSPTQRPLLENTQHSGETDIHDPGGIRTSNPSKRTVADPRLGARLLGLARMILKKQCNWGLGAEDSISYLVLTNALINPLNAELNPICHLLAFLRAHHILHVSRIRVKLGYTTKENFWTVWVDVSF